MVTLRNVTAYFDAISKIVIVNADGGEVTTDNVKKAVSEALALSKKHDCNFLLFDISKMKEAQSILQGFLNMKDVSKSFGLTLKHKCAVVYDPSNYTEQRAQFIENVVVNRPNPLIKMFKTEAEAKQWLTSGNN